MKENYWQMHKRKQMKQKPGLRAFMPFGQEMDRPMSTCKLHSECICHSEEQLHLYSNCKYYQ